MQETPHEAALRVITSFCLDVHEERSVFDIPKICEHPLEAGWIFEQLAVYLHNSSPIDGFLSPDYAGTFIGLALQQQMIHLFNAFIPLYRFRKNGTLESLPAVLTNKKYIIVEDVVTSGTSVLPLVRLLEERGGTLGSIITVVNRPEGGGEFLLKEYGIPFYFLYTTQEILTYYGAHK